MTLTLADVEHIARLARLSLTDEEKQVYLNQLSDILSYAARLQELDTDNIPPTTGSLQSSDGNLRADVPRPGLTRDLLQSNAPLWQDDQFRVPPVIE